MSDKLKKWFGYYPVEGRGDAELGNIEGGEEEVRTSIPDGISQSNRAHPLFIILRKCAEDEEVSFRFLIDHMPRMTTWAAFMILTGSCAVAFVPELRPAAAGLLACLGIALIQYLSFLTDIRKVVRNGGLIFPKVNKMLYSNDFSGARLNYENVTNLIAEAKSSLTHLEWLKRTISVTTILLTLFIGLDLLFAALMSL